ncbi:hypothetical protein DL764_009362 [Monosporascus ibericus]|uniref:Uncharacterized protein n=1 Tax=Monosporascus ibericus TaxID=155417 RepID=A0A4Q4SV64_9PEZI|nr:hypothetical protein DL764_009362 [Monosporascus ibericus]
MGGIFKVDDDTTTRAVYALGYSHDHICFILEEENAMFTSDNVLGHGTAAVEELSTWMESLRVMQSYGYTTGYLSASWGHLQLTEYNNTTEVPYI